MSLKVNIEKYFKPDVYLDDVVHTSSTAGLLKNDGTVDTTSYATSASVSAITDGQSIDSFSEVETALADKADASDIPEEMPTVDMSEVVTPLPSVMSRRFKYSTQEQIIGEWIDGKPLYQKTIVDTMPNTTDKTKASKTILSDASIETFVNSQGFLLYSDGISMLFPIVSGGTSNNYPEISGRIHTTNSPVTSVSVQSWSSSHNGKPVYVTVQYTKTTDTVTP